MSCSGDSDNDAHVRAHLHHCRGQHQVASALMECPSLLGLLCLFFLGVWAAPPPPLLFLFWAARRAPRIALLGDGPRINKPTRPSSLARRGSEKKKERKNKKKRPGGTVPVTIGQLPGGTGPVINGQPPWGDRPCDQRSTAWGNRRGPQDRSSVNQRSTVPCPRLLHQGPSLCPSPELRSDTPRVGTHEAVTVATPPFPSGEVTPGFQPCPHASPA